MSRQSTYVVESWDEDIVFEEENGRKMVTAKVSQSYSGHIQGKSRVEYVMYYLSATRATFVGIEVIEASVDGKSGTFTVRHVGEYDSGPAKSEWTVVDNSGTDGLANISGQGSYEATGREVVTEHTLEFS